MAGSSSSSVQLNSYLEVPSFKATTLEEVSMKIEDFVLGHPVSMVIGLGQVLNINPRVFSMEALVQASPDHPGTLYMQYQQPGVENFVNERPSWSLCSTPCATNLSKYWRQQKAAKNEALDAQEQRPDVATSSRSSHNQIVFSAIFDFFAETSAPFTAELRKIPASVNYASAGNMLTLLGQQVMDFNRVRLNMLPPGARRPCHQANGNSCIVNLNIGPGVCEWFVVPHEYVRQLRKLVEQRTGLSYFFHDSWPDLAELHAKGIPVYRFKQAPGDLVWMDAGNLFWVCSLGMCTSAEWRFAPVTSHQFQVLGENYRAYTRKQYKPTVPLIHLIWALAAEVSPCPKNVYEHMKKYLTASMDKCTEALSYLNWAKTNVFPIGRQTTKPVSFCRKCHFEIFNLLMISRIDENFSLCCFECAQKLDFTLAGFHCLQERSMNDLMAIYDQFEWMNISYWNFDDPQLQEFNEVLNNSNLNSQAQLQESNGPPGNQEPIDLDLTFEDCMEVFKEVIAETELKKALASEGCVN